jgi:hypothetical protein
MLESAEAIATPNPAGPKAVTVPVAPSRIPTYLPENFSPVAGSEAATAPLPIDTSIWSGITFPLWEYIVPGNMVPQAVSDVSDTAQAISANLFLAFANPAAPKVAAPAFQNFFISKPLTLFFHHDRQMECFRVASLDSFGQNIDKFHLQRLDRPLVTVDADQADRGDTARTSMTP